MDDTLFDVSTFGEAMLRLSVPAGERMETAVRFDVFPAGAEANVVAALNRFGHTCAWVGSLPNSPLGRLISNALRLAGVNLDGVVWCDEGRVGTFFVEFAVPPRPTKVVYDRDGSCTALLRLDQIDLSYFMKSRLVHLTGITPALSPTCRELVIEIVKRARSAGIPVSFDINYRQALWSESEAAATLGEIVHGVSLLLCKEADAQRLFGCNGTPEQTVQELAERTGAEWIVVSLGEKGAIGWNGRTLFYQAALPVQIIDRLGAGDALSAGVIHGWLQGDLAEGLSYGAALAGLALSQRGDMVVTTKDEVESLIDNSTIKLDR